MFEFKYVDEVFAIYGNAILFIVGLSGVIKLNNQRWKI
jgi:hypothetical protein